MPEPSRGLQISRRRWLLAGLLAPLFPARAADNLIVTYDGDNLHISSLGVHFLQGKSLDRLKRGTTVEYVATVGLYRDQFATQFKRLETHFFLSYDVLGNGDFYQVTTPGPPRRRITNLSQSDAETWCMERLLVAPSGLTKDQDFWLQLELRSVPPKLDPILEGSRLHIDVIEILTPGQDEKQVYRTPPLRLRDLEHSSKGRLG